MNKDLTYDGKMENEFNFEKALDYTCQWLWQDKKCEQTVNIYENDMRPFINTYSNIEEMVTELHNKNKNLFFSFEPIDSLIMHWWKQTHLNGRSWRRVAMEILNRLENECEMSYQVAYNPYYELSEEEVLEIENNLRSLEGEEPVNKFFRNE